MYKMKKTAYPVGTIIKGTIHDENEVFFIGEIINYQYDACNMYQINVFYSTHSLDIHKTNGTFWVNDFEITKIGK